MSWAKSKIRKAGYTFAYVENETGREQEKFIAALI
jgi:hypothetical protein